MIPECTMNYILINCIFVPEFGNEEMKLVTAHFSNILGDDGEEARDEWPTFRSTLYAR